MKIEIGLENYKILAYSELGLRNYEIIAYSELGFCKLLF